MFTDPIQNIAQFDIKMGSTVADFGSGSGHYALALARSVGEKGRVYAIDIQKELLSKTKKDANSAGYLNVEVIWGDLEAPGGSRLKDAVLDTVIISNLMFQVENKSAVVKEAARILKPGGKVCLVEWSDSFGGIGPQPQSVLTKENAESMFVSSGFVMERELDVGAHHYGFIFTKPK